MKKTAWTLASLVFATIILFSVGCKKDETPTGAITLKTLLKGKWEVTAFTVNDMSMLSYNYPGEFECLTGEFVPYTENFSMTDFNMTFGNPNTFSMSYIQSYQYLNYDSSTAECQAIYDTGTTPYNPTGTWELSADEKTLTMYDEFNEPMMNWEVLDHSSKIIHLQMTDTMDFDIYKMTLEK
jgi:hypothetical protein